MNFHTRLVTWTIQKNSSPTLKYNVQSHGLQDSIKMPSIFACNPAQKRYWLL